MLGFDLDKCLNCKDEAFLSRFGRIPSFAEVESCFASIRGTDKPLRFSELRLLRSKKLWDFDDFWTIPPKRDLKKRLKETKGIFVELPLKEEHTIRILYDILKNIEVVSVVLRFIDPTNYGIISPPVRYAIRQGPGKSYVDEYMEFLRVLRQYREMYHLDKVADVDIALWVLFQKCIFSGSSFCKNFREYREAIVHLDEEIIKKSRAFREMQDELLSIVAESEKNREAKAKRELSELGGELLASVIERETRREDELRRKSDELKVRESALEKELEGLKMKRAMYPENLIRLDNSEVHPKAKLIHDRREGPVDLGQAHFIDKLTGISVVNKVIWSENTTSRTKTRISHVKNDGEITILYVNKDGYAARIKAYPVICPDLTHAKCFANVISKVMDIPIADLGSNLD
jgi:hypothetical protein